MKQRLLLSLFVLFLLTTFVVQAQEPDVTGRVLSRTTGEPVAGATVTNRQTGQSVVADSTGAFRIPAVKGAVLVFSHTSMGTREYTVNNASTISIEMVESAGNLNEVVVVGYGTQRKSLVTGAISSVKASEIATVSAGRVEQALQGRTAGVTILPASGAPGSGLRVRIRGTGTNGSSEPLYIVDGIRTGSIDYLDPSEIASVEVLKDAASAAIYGAEGANGVVIISTKTGKKTGSAEVSYSGQYGQQSLRTKLKMMNASQYVAYLNAAGAPGAPVNVTPEMANTNWFDEVFQTAPLQRHVLNVSGGTERSTFLVGGTLFTQQGIAGGEKASFDRYTVRLNSDHKIKSWLNIGNRFSYSNFTNRGIQEDNEFGSVINNAIVIDPTTPVKYTGALPAHAQAALNAGHPLVRDANGAYYGISPFIFGEVGNPLAQIEITKGESVINKVVGNVYADVDILKGLRFTSRYGIDAAFQRVHGWTPTFWFSAERLNTAAGGYDYSNTWFNWQWENFATYQRRIGDHNFTALGGVSALKRNWSYLGGTYSGLFKEEDLFAYGDFTPDEQDRIGSNANSNTLASYYGRLTYDYANKYLLSVNIRRDGSSLLPPNNQWGTFPSVSAGWVVSNENFYGQGLKNTVGYLKLRASWGRNGSLSNLGIGQYAAAISSSGILYPDAQDNVLVGAAPTSLGNPELRWETSEQVDVGADLTLFNNRLSVTTDYYVKTTKDLLTPGTPPLFAGNNLPQVNGGNVENRGWELELTYRNNQRNRNTLSYEVAGNITTIRNRVTYLNPNVNEIGGAGVGTGWSATVFKQGFPIWFFRGYKTDGIFQNEGEITKYLGETGITGYTPKPGEPIVVDVNGDKVISAADQTYIGSPHPKLAYGGRVNLNYGGFDLLVFVQGQAGNDILMGFNKADRATANKPEFFYTNRWTGPGSTNTWFAPNTTSPYIYNSDLMIFDGSYTRVRQLQLGYTLPESVAGRARIRNARVYVSLDDFFTFTKYPGLDPEAGSGNSASLGIDRGVYPVPRKLLAGVSFTF